MRATLDRILTYLIICHVLYWLQLAKPDIREALFGVFLFAGLGIVEAAFRQWRLAAAKAKALDEWAVRDNELTKLFWLHRDDGDQEAQARVMYQIRKNKEGYDAMMEEMK